jgi:hypothetical protein
MFIQIYICLLGMIPILPISFAQNGKPVALAMIR